MSYNILHKEFRSSKLQTLATDIAEWVAENIPELTLAYKSTTSNTGKNYMAINGTTAGFDIAGYASGNTKYVAMYCASNITSSSGTDIGIESRGTVEQEIVSGETTYVTTATIMTTEGFTVVTIGGKTVIFGNLTSVLAGNGIFVSLVDYQDQMVRKISKDSSQTHMYHAAYKFNENGSAYVECSLITVTAMTTQRPSGSAILTPIYMVVETEWSEPFLIPNLYYVNAAYYPEKFEQTQIGGKEVVIVGEYGIAYCE